MYGVFSTVVSFLTTDPSPFQDNITANLVVLQLHLAADVPMNYGRTCTYLRRWGAQELTG